MALSIEQLVDWVVDCLMDDLQRGGRAVARDAAWFASPIRLICPTGDSVGVPHSALTKLLPADAADKYRSSKRLHLVERPASDDPGIRMAYVRAA
jgi:hypothetical protein